MSNSTTKSFKFRISIKTSATLISTHDDLLTEILLRLPIRSLIRFKSVSKHWLSLITSHQITYHPSRRKITSASGLFLHRSSFLVNPEHDFVLLDRKTQISKPPFKTLSFANDPFGIKIIQSCNGLLLCSTFRAPPIKQNYYIYNPTTSQFTNLPLSYNAKVPSLQSVNLAFDPSKSPHYKAVSVYYSDTLEHYEIEIYSSETGLWRPSGQPFRADVNFRIGTFWNNAIHCNESFDHLHLIQIIDRPTTKFNVYELERDYSGWFLKYKVDLEGIVNAFPETICCYLDPTEKNYYSYAVLSVVREENEEDSFMVVHVPGKAIRYKFAYKSLKKLCEFEPDLTDGEEDYFWFKWFDAFQFIESLAGV